MLAALTSTVHQLLPRLRRREPAPAGLPVDEDTAMYAPCL
jgi:hypothetical protein